MASEEPRIVYSEEAREDLANIYEYTSHVWGASQAESYSDYLEAKAEELVGMHLGFELENFPDYRAHFVRWKKARHGHYIVYRKPDQDIEVVRVLHSSMDLDSQLRKDYPPKAHS